MLRATVGAFEVQPQDRALAPAISIAALAARKPEKDAYTTVYVTQHAVLARE